MPVEGALSGTNVEGGDLRHPKRVPEVESTCVAMKAHPRGVRALEPQKNEVLDFVNLQQKGRKLQMS